MTPGERIAFMDSPIPGAPVDPKGSNWFTRVGTMAWNFNTLRLGSGSLFGEDPDVYGYIEAGYIPSNDNYVLENEWIKDFYPKAWDSLQESTSTLSSARKINRIIENHSMNMTLQEGSLFGNVLGAIPAALFDPVNFIPFAGPSLKALGMTRATAKLIKTRMALNSLENLVLTGVVEPLMRDHDLTRTAAHTQADMIGSMLLGGILPGVGAVIKKGVNKAKIGTTRRILGGKSPEEFVEVHADALTVSMKRQAAEDPEAAQVFERIENPKLIPLPSDFLKESTYLGKAMEEIKEGSSVILGIGGDSKLSKYLASWLVFNPNQRLLTNSNDGVKAIGSMLLRNNLVREVGLEDAAVEEILALVQQRMTMSTKTLVDMKKKYMSKEVETTLDKKLSDDELYVLVGELYVTGKSKISDVDDTFRVAPSEKSHGFEYQDPFAGVRLDPETVKTIEAMTKEARAPGVIIKETMDDSGFSTRQADTLHLVRKIVDQTSYLPRFVNHDRADLAVATDGTNLVIKGLQDGLEYGKQANLDLFGAIVREQDDQIARLEAHLENRTDPKLKKQKEYEIAVAQERRDAAYEMIEEFSTTGDDWTKIKKALAQRYDHQYRRIDSQAHGGAVHTGSAKELMSRKIFVDDRFLSPLMERNIIVIRKQMQTHLIPQLVMATTLIQRFEKFNLSLRLKNAADHLEKLKDKLEHSVGENRDFNDLTLWANSKDRAVDLSDELDVTTQLRLIDTDRTGGDTGHQIKIPRTKVEKEAGLPDTFETIEDIDLWIHQQVKTREQIRYEQDKALNEFVDITRLNDRQWQTDTLLYSLLSERNKLLLNDVFGNVHEELNYDTILKNQNFTPVNSKGEPIIYKPRQEGELITYALSEFSKKQASKIDWEYRINKKGKPYVHILSGSTGKGSIRKVKTAKNSEGESIKFEEETGREGTYLQIKDKFLWINPVEIKEKLLIAIDKERVSGTRTDVGGEKFGTWDKDKFTLKVIKELILFRKKIRKTDIESSMFKERIEEQGVRRSVLAKRRVEELNELIIKEIDLLPKQMKGRIGDINARDQEAFRSVNDKTLKSYKTFKSKENTFFKLTDDLNTVAKDITVKTFKYSGWEHLAKDHISNMKVGDSPSDFIGFNSSNSLFERRSLQYNPYRRLIIGAADIDRITERKNYMSEYEYTILRIERARRNAAYFATDPNQVVSQAKRFLEDPDQPGGQKEFVEIKKDIEYVYSQLLNRNVWAGDQHGVQTAISILKNLNFMRYMGMVTIASLSDFGNAIGTLGMSRYVRTMWTYLGTPNRKNLSEFSRLNSAFEVASLENRANKWGGLNFDQDVYDPVTQQRVDTSPKGKLRTIDRATNVDSKLMSIFNIGHMLNKWNGFQKRIVTLGVEDMIGELGIARWNGGGKARAISERDRGIAQSMGFNDSDLIQIGQMHERFGGKKRFYIW